MSKVASVFKENTKWKTLFIVSAVLGLCNSAYAATIKVPQR